MNGISDKGCDWDNICTGQNDCVLDNLSDAIARYDAQCRCIYVNRAYELASGLIADQVIGKTPLECSDLAETVAHSINNLLETVVETEREEGAEIVWKEGNAESGTHYLLAIPELDSTGQVREVLTVASDISMKKMAEKQYHQIYTRLRVLAERRAADWEEERRQLAWDLQEEMGQIMTALKVRIETIRMSLDSTDPYTAGLVQEVSGLADKCIGMSKEMVDALRPATLDLGIKPALEWLSDVFSRKSGIACKLHIDHFPDVEDETLATILFRVVQVALDNVANYAKADIVEISLEESAEEYVLGVTDNGEGFATEQTKMSGFGLLDMQERVAMQGGQMVVFSAPGQGTVVEARLPITGKPLFVDA
jgi:PAS domain S-box-containing protein